MPNTIQYTPENVILSYFETGDFPTQPQFAAAWTSYWHKGSLIPIASIDNLMQTLQGFASAQAFETHLQDTLAHAGTLALLDASNLNLQNVNSWKEKLGVDSVPNNVGLVDAGFNQSVYNKEQIEAICLIVDDFVNDGKIRADKIEALGLTEVIKSVQTSLADFVLNSDDYEFQENDFIAIPDLSGNYSLYLFIGNDKSDESNYLPTGLTNITISMVEGLQAVLDGKLDKPTSNGDFYISKTIVGGVPSYQYKAITHQTGEILKSYGGYIGASAIKEDTSGKVGVGQNSPTEKLHVDGRVKAKAVVLDVNSETLPNQITTDGTRFSGSGSTGVKRGLMYRDFADYKALWQNLTDAEKNDIKTIANGGWTTNTMSVGIISPPVAGRSNSNMWISLKGANLNLNPANFSLEFVDLEGIISIATIPNSQVQLYSNGIDLSFYFNFSTIPNGEYKIRIWNGMAYYVTSFSIKVTDNLEVINFGSITWETKLYTPGTIDVLNISGGGMNYNAKATNKPFANENVVVSAAKSSQFVASGEDFYISGTIQLTEGANSQFRNILGFVDPLISLQLLDNSILNVRWESNNVANQTKTLRGGDIVAVSNTNESNSEGSFIIVRNGALFTVLVQVGSTVRIGTKISSSGALSLVSYLTNNSNAGASASFNIQIGYKF